MKTTFLKLIILLLCIGGFTAGQAQGLYNLATLDEEYGDSPLKFTSGLSQGDVSDTFDEGVEWADFTIGGGAGIGFSDTEGNNDTSFCLSAEFLARIWGDQKNPDGAGYAGVFGTYHNSSGEFQDESGFKVGAKVSHFDRISAFNEVQLIYGLLAFYETGSRDFSGFEDDYSGIGASAFAGVNFKVSNKVSIGVEVPVLSYLSRTFDSNGSEFKEDSFSAAINKNNPITATARIALHRLKWGDNKDTDGDGIWDKDDECPDLPGLEHFNGCPDSDNDGIQDNLDGCPNEAGLATNNGCPETDGK